MNILELSALRSTDNLLIIAIASCYVEEVISNS